MFPKNEIAGKSISKSMSVSYGTISAATTTTDAIAKIPEFDDMANNYQKNKSSRNYFIGVTYMLTSAIALSGQGVCIKYGTQLGYHPFELLLSRGIIQAMLTVLVVIFQNCFELNSKQIQNKSLDYESFSGSIWFYLILRGVLAFGTAYFSYCGWSLLPLGDAVSLFSTFPIWTVIVCAVFVKEKIRIYHIVSIISAIIGVVLITQPSFIFNMFRHSKSKKQQINYLGVFLCLFAAIINGFAFLCLRKMKKVKAFYSVFAYSFGVIVGSLFIGLCFDGKQWKGIDLSNYDDLTLLLSIGIFGFFGQFLKTKSCQYIEGGVGSIVRSTDVIFAYLWQIVLFGVIPSKLTMSGAFCVMLPIIIISAAKIMENGKKNIKTECNEKDAIMVQMRESGSFDSNQ